jgi:hypothetical protein
MVDFYGMPADAWPGRNCDPNLPNEQKATSVEFGMANEIAQEMGEDFNPGRFVPFVVMHEFEGLLFSDCSAFAQEVGCPQLKDELAAIRAGFPTPEDINDSLETAPSKRIRALYPKYEKVLHGTVVALQIGVDKIEQECPHFSDWLRRLREANEELT